LKSDQGRAVFYDLIRKADIVFDNFRPGVLERLNLEYERLWDVNPGIISVSLRGFGQDGPWAERPGYDIIVQALSGAMSLTGHTVSDPARIPLHLGDTGGGLYGALAMSTALSSRQRTGEGCRLDLSLLDCQLALLGDEVTHFGATGVSPDPYGASHPYMVPYTAFRAEDPRFKEYRSRVANRDDLEGLLQEIFETGPRDTWLEVLIEHDVPAAPVLGVGEAIQTPQAQHRQMTGHVSLSTGEAAQLSRFPVRVADAPPHPLRAAPKRGEHSRTLLGDLLGYTEAEIATLAEAGLIG
jgi:CoA:oxalate CoA-transferase